MTPISYDHGFLFFFARSHDTWHLNYGGNFQPSATTNDMQVYISGVRKEAASVWLITTTKRASHANVPVTDFEAGMQN